MTVERARANLFREATQGKPGRCPCCDHWVQFYRRRFHRTMALDVLWLAVQHREQPNTFVRVYDRVLYGRQYAAGTGDLGKLKYWSFAEPAPNDDPKKKTSGLWRITPRGLEFARDERVASKWAIVYLDEVKEFLGPSIDIGQALGQAFDYSDLMRYDARWWEG